MAPASLHQQLRGGVWNPRALAEHARYLGWPLSMPAPSRAVLSPYRRSDHKMPRAKMAPVDDQVPPPLVSSIPQQPTTPS